MNNDENGNLRPALRSAITLDYLETIESQSPGLVDEVRALLSKDAADCLFRATRASWFPMDYHMEINEATRKMVGLERYRNFWRLSLALTTKSPLLSGVLASGSRLFGWNPLSLVKLTPRTWGMLFRKCGKTFHQSTDKDNSIDLILKDCPKLFLKSGTFAEGLKGCWESYFDIYQGSGEVSIVSQDIEAGEVVFNMTLD
jgi:hypothetical protein